MKLTHSQAKALDRLCKCSELLRAKGGYWHARDVVFSKGRPLRYELATDINHLVTQGFAMWGEYKIGQYGRFPVRVVPTRAGREAQREIINAMARQDALSRSRARRHGSVAAGR